MAYDPAKAKREEIAESLRREGDPVLIPPYDHVDVIAGQGTAAKELFEEFGELDLLLVCCGGGGLLSGSALCARALSPRCRVVGVEPELADDATRSFRTGTLHTVTNPPTIADGARTPSLGTLTFPLVRQNVDDMTTVSDDDLVRAMRFVWERMKLVVEPTGVLGLAAALAGKVDVAGKRAGVILSGGNVDLGYAADLFGALPPEPPPLAAGYGFDAARANAPSGRDAGTSRTGKWIRVPSFGLDALVGQLDPAEGLPALPVERRRAASSRPSARTPTGPRGRSSR